MKTKIKFWQIILISVVLLIVLFFSYNFIVFNNTIKKMTILDTAKITENLYIVKGKITNMYIYKDGDDIICFDAADDINTIAEGFKKLNIDPNKVKGVFLSHSDSDHIKALEIFTKAETFLSRDEKQIITGNQYRFFFFKNPIIKKCRYIDDKDIFKINKIKVKAISTPGHTPGSMSFLLNDEILYTGDNLAIQNGKIVNFFEFFNMDTNLQKKSIKDKLSNLTGIKYTLTAHTGYITNWDELIKEWK